MIDSARVRRSRARLRVTNYDSDVPGVFGFDVRLGLTAGTNVFRITVGDATIDVTITGN